MKRMEYNVAAEVISIIAEISGYELHEIKPETNLTEELEIDSIKAIEIAVFIEKKFKISLRDEDIAKIKTTQEIIDMTERLVEARVG